MNIPQEGKEDVGRKECRRMRNGEFLQPVLSQYLGVVGGLDGMQQASPSSSGDLTLDGMLLSQTDLR